MCCGGCPCSFCLRLHSQLNRVGLLPLRPSLLTHPLHSLARPCSLGHGLAHAALQRARISQLVGGAQPPEANESFATPFRLKLQPQSSELLAAGQPDFRGTRG